MSLTKINKKVINAWATYDLANSVYNLVITATLFPIYYNAVTITKDKITGETSNIVSFLGMEIKNTTLYDFAIAFAFLVVAFLSPLLSGIADYGGSKKRFLKFFCYLGASSCAAMYFFGKGELNLGIGLAILACIGFAGSLVFYNSYLPEIAPPRLQDRVSAKGFALGYVGSSVLLIINLVMVLKPQLFGWEKINEMGETVGDPLQAMRFAFVLVGLWWAGFAQITFYHLPKIDKSKIKEKKLQGHYLTHGFNELKKVWTEFKDQKQLTRFLPAFFVYSMGVQTVMLVATHFGSDEIHMESGQLITTILIIQFVAMAGSYLFSFLSRKNGNIHTLKVATFVWAAICIGTYYLVYTPVHFYVVAGLVGLVMGGTQSLSRSTYSKMLPVTEDNTSYFSFYDVCEKLSIVAGMASFGIINECSDTMRTPILALIAFFVVGFLLLMRLKEVK